MPAVDRDDVRALSVQLHLATVLQLETRMLRYPGHIALLELAVGTTEGIGRVEGADLRIA
jgi:hypothetical protein